MSLKCNLKGAIKIMALVCAFAGPSLFAAPIDERQVIAGVQGKIEYLGTRVTREMKRRSVEDSLITVAAVKKSNEQPFQALAKSSSYNPSTPFFRTGLNVDVASVSDVLRVATPPDTNGAIGPEQFIIALNNVIRSFDRNTGLPDGVLDSVISSFFGVNSIADPHILYDHFANVWYLVAMSRGANPGGLDIAFAVSHDCVITDCTEWDFYRVPGTFLATGQSAPALDYPMMGYDSEAVYITINVWTTGFASFIGPSLCVFQKSSLLAGNPFLTLFPIFYTSSDPNIFTGFVAPITNFDRDIEYGYLMQTPIWNFLPQTFNYLTFFRVLNPGSFSPTLATPINIQVPVYIVGPFGVPALGNLFPTDNLLDHGPSFVPLGVVRKGQLYTAYGNLVDATGPTLNPDRGRISWAQLDLSGDSNGCSKLNETASTLPAIVQSGTIEDTATVNPRTYWTSSIAVNKLGDVVISGNTSGPNEYINVFYSARKRSDPQNTFRNPILVTDNTSVPFNFGAPTPFQRWGDYSSIFVDPCNDINFWLTNEAIGVENGWSIRATELIRIR